MADFLEIPYPSDAYLQNGKIAPPNLANVVHASADFLAHEIAKMNGFSRVAFSNFYVDDPNAPPLDDGSVAPAKIDTSTLPQNENDCTKDSSSVFLLDLEATDGASARLPCRASVSSWDLSKTRPTLGVGPARGLVLAAKHRYATVVTSRVKTQDGKSIGPAADFTKLDRTLPASAACASALDAIKKYNLVSAPDTIVGIAPYTTHAQDEELYGMRDALENAQIPALKWGASDLAPMGAARFGAGLTASLDDWLGVVDPQKKLPDGTDDPDEGLPVRAHDAIAAVGTAVFDAQNFLISKPNGYQDIDHATFSRDASGKIIPAPDSPTAKIWATFAVPTGAMPANGYPKVIIQHGLGGSRAYLMVLANTFCKNGWVAVAIDSVTFGARAPEADYQHDNHTDYESAPGAKYKGPDGIADPGSDGARNGSNDLFGGLKNIGALRDQMRQAELDTAQLVKLLGSSPALDPLKMGAKIDGAHVAYIGDSLGGIQGAVSSASEPPVSA